MEQTGSDAPEPRRATSAFAPVARATPDALRRSISAVADAPLMVAVVRSFGGIVMVLNPQRQIIAVNDELLRLLGCEDPHGTLGLRPGEALGCVHAADNPEGGCGTSRFCRSCGAAVAIVSSQQTGEPAEAECLLTVRLDHREEAFEFRVNASPLPLGAEIFTVITLQDISDRKRREALEQVFLHDIANTAMAVSSSVKLLALCDDEERAEVLQAAIDLSDRLMAEITEQRELARLEAGDYEPRRQFISMVEIRELTEQFFAGQKIARGKTLAFSRRQDHLLLYADPVLLRRVLANLIKNALEATPLRGDVRVGVDVSDDRIGFRVWNAGAMAPEVARRVFQRYFSTKDEPGRGLGTYGAKLIAERYLGGAVAFTTSDADGTTFHLTFPRAEPARA